MRYREHNPRSSKLFLILFGLFFMLVPMFMIFEVYSGIENKETAEGVLVGYDERYSRDNGYTWSGIYEFKVDNETYTCTSNVSTSPKSLIKKKTTIIYEKTNPAINRTKTEILFPLMFVGVGGVILICGIRLKVPKKIDYIEYEEEFF